MFEHLFGSKTRLKILRLFFSSPESPFYVRELVRLSGAQLNSVRRELSNLEEIGIIKPLSGQAEPEKKNSSRSKFYLLNPDCKFFYELKELLNKIQMVEEQEILEEIKDKAGEFKLFLLTGIFTQVEKTETDILFVGKVKPVILEKMMQKFEKLLGREIRYTVMDETEFLERREIGDRFLYTLLDAKHFTVVSEFNGID